MKHWTYLIPFLLLLSASACSLMSTEEQEVDRSEIRPLTEAEQHVTEADNLFGFELFQALSDREPDANLFISPLSVSMALGMTLNGAGGDTYSAMQETLALSGLSQQTINESYQSLIELLSSLDPRVTFEIANSVWYRQGFSVEDAFLETNQTYFDAEVRPLDFDHPEAVDVINEWVDEKTHGKIEEIVKEIRPEVVMYLINAIYFKGIWTYEFDEADTREENFHQYDGSTTSVPMMQQQADLAYFENDVFQAVDLPYGDSLFSMTVLLPRRDGSVDEVVAALDGTAWNAWTQQFQARGVDLRLPRFKLEYEASLKDVLSALGMAVAFDCSAADFSRINPTADLCISEVRHKSFVEVNEEGTEAAAVTSVEIIEMSTGGGGLVSFHVDRPFVFLIREQHSGTILFMGKVLSL